MKSILFILMLVISWQAGHACQCAITFNDFFESFLWNDAHRDYRLVVAMGVSTSVLPTGDGIRFKILRSFYEPPVRDTAIIWGTDFTDCRLDVVGMTSPPGRDTVIFIMRQLKHKFVYQDTSDYEVSACGVYYMYVRNDSVFGGAPGTFAYDGYPLHAFEDSMRKLRPPLTAFASKPLVAQIAPNPARNHIMVKSGQKVSKYSITNSMGQVLRSCSSEQINGTTAFQIDLANLLPGIYSLRLWGDRSQQVIKFLKE